MVKSAYQRSPLRVVLSTVRVAKPVLLSVKTTCVAEKKSKTFEVQTFECVPAEKTVSYTVCVPHQVEKQVQVQVVKMVPKTVTVPECGGCDSAPCGHGRRCRGC